MLKSLMCRKKRKKSLNPVVKEVVGEGDERLQVPIRRLDYCSFYCIIVGVIPCHVFGNFRQGFWLHLLQL